MFGRRIGGLKLGELVDDDATRFAQSDGRTGLVVKVPARRGNIADITRSSNRDLQAVRSIADPRLVAGDVVRVRRGGLYIVTDIPGGYVPLAHALATLNEQDRIRIVNDVAEALTVAHQQRCVHGAIGIGAVLVSKESALLAGFGCRNLTPVVREVRRGSHSNSVSASTAPELRGGAAASFATDVFAFGALVDLLQIVLGSR